MTPRVLVITTGLALLGASPTLAASIELNDGTIIVGEVTGLQSGIYSIRRANGQTIPIPATEVKGIASGGPQNAAGPKQTVAPAAPGSSLIQPGTLRFAGSNTVGERLAPAMALDYFKAKGANAVGPTALGSNEVAIDAKVAPPGLPTRIEVRAHGSGTAFKALAGRESDVGMSSRPILQKEVIDLASLGDMTGPASEHVLALDGLAIIVNPNNPVGSLSKDQVARIFSCQIKDWSEVGGKPGPINLYARDDKSGTFDTFKHIALGDTKLCDAAKRFESSEDLSENVAKDLGGIGFIGFAYIGSSRPVPIAECRITYPPTAFTVKTEEYPLSRRLFLYTPGSHPPEVDNFLVYARSDAGQRVVAQTGFVDLGIVPDDNKTQSFRRIAALPALGRLKTVEEFVTATEGATRLSVTFRFRTGSADLDNRAIHDLERLASYMKGSLGQSRKLMLLGFTDSDGRYDANVHLSRQRAQAIAEMLTKRGIAVSYVGGFGPEAPIACNETTNGKERNRHVEVWVR